MAFRGHAVVESQLVGHEGPPPTSMMRLLFLLCLAFLFASASRTSAETVYLLKPARVFDGESAQLHENWVVLVRGDKIVQVGPASSITAQSGAKVIDLPGLTLMPGLIEAHSHVLLHPYTETVWNDQVAQESLSLRVARATNHLRNTLQAGFTTIRDLGTEGAGYADVGLKQAVEQGIIPGPRMLVTTEPSLQPAVMDQRVMLRSGPCRKELKKRTVSTV